LLVEAAWHAARSAGPLRACHQRIAARRGSNVATVATARKMVALVWHLLSRGEDDAFARPALVRKKIHRLELMLGAPRHQGRSATGRAHLKTHQRQAEHALVEQAEQAYRRLVADWQSSRPKATRGGRGRDTGARISQALEAQRRAADSVKPQGLRFASSVTRAHD
jgi:hypothetical protein